MSRSALLLYDAPMRVIPRTIAAGVLVVAGVAAAAAPSHELPPFPNLELHSLKDGSVSQLEGHRGHPVLVTFWASWCAPCRMEMPEIQKLYGDLKGAGFEVVAINLDTSPEPAKRFVDMLGLSLPVYRADPMTVRRIGVTSLPTSVLLDPSGYPIQIYEGYEPGVVKDIRQRVQQMLQEPPGAASSAAESTQDAGTSARG